MPSNKPVRNEFIDKITALIGENITNEQFGVSELADLTNMSRSNLLRKVKKETNLSVSQLISQVRLLRAMELLRTSSLNVSEVSDQVGFGSPSYFIKCFREYYGYPPGEVGDHDELQADVVPTNVGQLPETAKPRSRKNDIAFFGFVGMLAISGILAYASWPSPSEVKEEKSIAVLPFINDSNDSTNVYLINGLMESTLNNLQKIQNLKVVSRTSAEKYRNSSKSIPEIAKELNVQYFVEGSGQKMGDRIVLNIQLIEAATDKHLWSKQYRRESKDIFALQQEIAINIAQEIQVVITPDVAKRIEKNPTEDAVAYDYYLKGKELFYQSTAQSLEKSIPYFQKAIEKDKKFALAYANAVMVYYYLDIFNIQKKYSSEINRFSDQAMLLDPKSGESLIAKGLSFAHKKDYNSAVPYLEKALEENPDSGIVLHFLAEFYSLYVPHVSKYVECAAKKVRLDGLQDSATASFNYMHLSNSLLQAGFIDETILYIDKSMAYNPRNMFGAYVKAYAQYARDHDYNQTKQILLAELKLDTNRMDILQELGKTCYRMRDFKSARHYYKRFITMKELYHLDLFRQEDVRISVIMAAAKSPVEAKSFSESFRQFAEQDHSINRNLYLAMYYALIKDTKIALNHLTQLSHESEFQYGTILYELNDPVFDSIRERAEFKTIKLQIEDKFQSQHDAIASKISEDDLLKGL